MRLLILLLAAIAVLGAGAAPASAGTFHVYGLGLNSAGCPNGWIAQSSDSGKFQQGNLCSHWEIRSTGTVAEDHWAGASMFTGAGARFTGASIRSGGSTGNGMHWQLMMCTGWFSGCATYPLAQGSWGETEFGLGSLSATGTPYHAAHVFAGVWCHASSCNGASGNGANVTQRESHAVVEDYTPPGGPSLSGVSTSWNSGQRALSYSANDAGSGVESVTLTIDGSLHRTNTHSCLRLPAGGYMAPVPCSVATGGEFVLNEPGQLADGPHTLTVTTRDAGGEAGSSSQDFYVDNNAPGHPLNLAVTGGDGWRGSNDFGVTWENPEQGNGSPIAGGYYKIGSAPTTPTDGTRVASLTDLSGLQVPGDGIWGLYIWLIDEAGNVSNRVPASTELRLDSTAPTAAFTTERDEHNPAEVRVDTSDATSGVAGGLIEIRKQGLAEWRPLDTRLEGTQLITTIPDGELERGTYELQASAWDVVGNRATTNRRADGEEMLVDLPLRGDTRLNANLARGAEGSGRALPSIRVGYRKRAWLRGVLRSGSGAPLPDTRVTIFSRPLAGGDWQALTELVTNGRGGYAARIPAGGSRELRVHFPGTRLLRPADDVAKLLVRGWAKLKLKPKRLRRGRTIRFRGHVGILDAALPPAGKLIQIQYLDGRRWRPAVKLGRTDGTGHFDIGYRFRRISRPTKIFFRILIPAEAGWPYVTGASKPRKAFVRP